MPLIRLLLCCLPLVLTFNLNAQKNDSFSFEEYLNGIQEKAIKFKVNKTKEKIGGKKYPIRFLKLQDSVDFTYYSLPDQLLSQPICNELDFDKISNNQNGTIQITVSKVYNELIKSKSIVFFQLCGQHVYYGYFEYDLKTQEIRVEYSMWADTICA